MVSACRKVVDLAEDIRRMRIRGAGEIGRAAALGLSISAQESEAEGVEEFMEEMRINADTLIHARPTAVSLPNSVRFVMHRLMESYKRGLVLEALRKVVADSAKTFIQNSRAAVRRIGDLGVHRVEDGDTILTHCNSEAALAIIKKAFSLGKRIKVIATETRPLFQGHITARQLRAAGVEVTLIVDSAARHFMKDVDKVIVGADAVAANGAVINKIGTSAIALAAHEARVHFLVAAETYKFSSETMIGELVEIEERPVDEVVDEDFLKKYPSIKVRNPAFDVTPPEYIDLIITERGAIPPQAAVLLLREEYGWTLGEEGSLKALD